MKKTISNNKSSLWRANPENAEKQKAIQARQTLKRKTDPELRERRKLIDSKSKAHCKQRSLSVQRELAHETKLQEALAIQMVKELDIVEPKKNYNDYLRQLAKEFK